jgi:hypothetical protein
MSAPAPNEVSLQEIGRIGFDIHEGAPGIVMARELLHEGGIAVAAGMSASHIGIEAIVYPLDIGPGQDRTAMDFGHSHGW